MSKQQLAGIIITAISIISAVVLAIMGKVSGDNVLAWIFGVLSGGGALAIKKPGVQSLLLFSALSTLSGCATLGIPLGQAIAESCKFIRVGKPVADVVCEILPEDKKKLCLAGTKVVTATEDDVTIELGSAMIKICRKK